MTLINDSPSPADEVGPSPSSPDTTTLHLLVIDDDPLTAQLMHSIADPHWVIRHALNGLMGLDSLRSDPRIGLVILDIHMPGLDGRQTAAQIRARYPAIPIIPYTIIDPVQEDILLAQYLHELGCAPIITKGIAPEQIRAAIDTAQTTQPAFTNSAVLQQLQRELAYRETAMRQDQRTDCIGIYAGSSVTQHGLKQILEATTHDTTIQTLTTMDCLVINAPDGPPPMVVTTIADYLVVLDHAQRVGYCLSLLLLLTDATVAEAPRLTDYLQSHPAVAALGVLVEDTEIMSKLPQALAALRTQHHFRDPIIARSHAQRREQLRQQLATSYNIRVNDNELTLLLLQMDHADSQQIATTLNTSLINVYKIRSRLVQRAGVPTIRELIHVLTTSS